MDHHLGFGAYAVTPEALEQVMAIERGYMQTIHSLIEQIWPELAQIYHWAGKRLLQTLRAIQTQDQATAEQATAEQAGSMMILHQLLNTLVDASGIAHHNSDEFRAACYRHDGELDALQKSGALRSLL